MIDEQRMRMVFAKRLKSDFYEIYGKTGKTPKNHRK
jgi:hypothetical protein